MWSGVARRIGRKPLLVAVPLLALALAGTLVPLILSEVNTKSDCPLYPEAVVVRSSSGITTYATSDTFGDVLKWYEGQHHQKGEIRPAPYRTPDQEVEASYSLTITHADAVFLVDVYTLVGEPQTFIDVANVIELGGMVDALGLS